MNFSFLFPLPKEALAKVKENQIIAPQDILAQYPQFQEEKVNVAQRLGVNNKSASKYLTVSLGSHVNKGDLLAEKSSFLKKRQVFSPVQGQAYAFDHQKGDLVLHFLLKQTNIYSPVKGKIKKIQKEGIKILVSGEIIPLLESRGQFIFGRVKLYHGPSYFLTRAEKGKILFTNTTISRLLIAKSVALGIRGIIGSHKETLPSTSALSLAILDKENWPLLEKNEGSFVILDPQQKKLAIINSPIN